MKTILTRYAIPYWPPPDKPKGEHGYYQENAYVYTYYVQFGKELIPCSNLEDAVELAVTESVYI